MIAPCQGIGIRENYLKQQIIETYTYDDFIADKTSILSLWRE